MHQHRKQQNRFKIEHQNVRFTNKQEIKIKYSCKKIKKKIKQTLTFTKIAQYMWTTSFFKTRHVYIVFVKSTITYAFVVWHAFNEIKTTSKIFENKLTVIQNKYFWFIVETFKIIFIQSLKIETYVISIFIHLNQLQIKNKLQLNALNQTTFIRTLKKRIKRKLKIKTKRKEKQLKCQKNKNRFEQKKSCQQFNKYTHKH